MTQIIGLLISIGSIVWSFSQPIYAWTPLIVAAIFFLFVLLGLKLRKWRYIEELSPSANEMFQKFGLFYSMPFAGRDFSGACSSIQFGAVVVGVVGTLNGFWWGIGLAVLFWVVLGPASMAFNPTNFIQNEPDLVAAHEEVIKWITSKQRR